MNAVRVAAFIALLAVSGFSNRALAAEHDDYLRFEQYVRDGMLDPDAPIERRRAYVAEIEAVALRDKHPHLFYLLGSLYRQGEDSPNSPVAKDIDRAREYLSRAALGGSDLAMAKLSGLELEASNRFEANVWAQLYFHYSKDHWKIDRQIDDSLFAASVIGAAQDGFLESQRGALDEAVTRIIVGYDTVIRDRLQYSADARARNPLQSARGDKCNLMNLQWGPQKAARKRYPFGMAEYYVAFAADGSVHRAWVLDGWPDSRFADMVRPCVMRYRVDPAAAQEAGNRLVLLPIHYSTNRHRIRVQDKQ